MATNKRKAPEPVGGSILLRTATASCEIGLFGGHILSWKVQGEEQMFMSSKAIMDGGESGNTAIRGGLPICWPQFGFFKTAANAPDAKHGFIRSSSNWVASHVTADSATLELTPDAAMKAKWPGVNFRFVYKVSIQGACLRVVAEVTNLGDGPVEFTGALHTYWQCENASDCRIEGLKVRSGLRDAVVPALTCA
jgi:glucose-6-phosphate 1-epimerase